MNRDKSCFQFQRLEKIVTEVKSIGMLVGKISLKILRLRYEDNIKWFLRIDFI